MGITIKKIKQVTADHFGISLVELDGVRRSRHIVRPRQIAMHCAVQLTRHSLPTIAEHFGKRDHTTVMHANKVIQERMDRDDEFEEIVDHLRQSVLNPPKYEFTARYSKHGYPLDQFHTCRMAAE